MQDVVTKRTIGRRFFWPAAVLTVFGAAFLYAAFRANEQVADAQVVNFYADDCVGGWDGVAHAAHEPQVTEGSDIEYSKDNSAYLENKMSPITCGNYVGVLPPETYHTRVMVRFSWKQDMPEPLPLPPAIPPANVVEDVGTSTGSSTEPEGSISFENGEQSTGADSVSLATSTDVGTTTETKDVSDADSSQSDAEEGAATSTAPDDVTESDTNSSVVEEPAVVVPAPEPKPEPEPEPTPEPTPEPVPESEPASDVVSWWSSMFPAYAHAEELAVETPAVLSATDTPAEEVVTMNANMASSTATSTDTLITPPVVSLETVPTGAQFVVQYTLDGVLWRTLGYVTTIDTDVRLEFPKEILPTLDDISHMKVSITPILQIDTIHPVFLDAVWLEVSYAPLGELGVHRISDIVPTITPFESIIVDTVATSSSDISSTSLPQLSMTEFANRINQVHGIDERYVLTTITTGTSTAEVWLFDMKHHFIHRIGRDKAQIGTMQAGTKDGMIFWLDAERDAIYSYDLRTAGSLHEMTLVGNLPSGTEYVLTFPFTAWEVIWRGDTFYFKTRKTGEVFQDENTNSAQRFFEYFALSHRLSYEHLQEIGGTFITEAAVVADSATSTDSGEVSTSTPEYATSTIRFDAADSSTMITQ